MHQTDRRTCTNSRYAYVLGHKYHLMLGKRSNKDFSMAKCVVYIIKKLNKINQYQNK